MDAHEALSQALAHLPEGGTLVVTGSFYLAGTVRPWLRARHVDAMQASWPGTVPGYAPRS
jgi:Folylpolyglutamate synthase